LQYAQIVGDSFFPADRLSSDYFVDAGFSGDLAATPFLNTISDYVTNLCTSTDSYPNTTGYE